MMHFIRPRFLIATTAIVAIAACDSGTATQPELSTGPVVLARPANDSSRTPTKPAPTLPDTGARPTPPPPRPDSTTPLPRVVTVSGKVLAVTAVAPTPGTRDTLRFVPVPGAIVKVYRNVVLNGDRSEELVAQGTSGSDGQYRITGIPGGYYLLRTTPPAGSNLSASQGYLSATKAEVTVDIHLWRAP